MSAYNSCPWLAFFITGFLVFCHLPPVSCQLVATTPDSTGKNCTYSGLNRCPSGFVCQKGLCVRRCFFQGSCPDGYKCQANFACVKTICLASDNNCCSHCPERCSKPGDCPQGWGCIFKKCRRVECQSSNDCEFNWPCVMGKCHPKICAKDQDCPENWPCGAARRCVKS